MDMNNVYPFNPINTTNPYLINNPIYNPAIQQNPIMQQPQRQIETANGKQGAFSFALGPNSSVILADAVDPKIWIVTTDSSGVKAVKGFKIIPDEEEEPKDPFAVLNERLDKLEERMDSYGQSNSRNVGQNKPTNGNTQQYNRNNSSGTKPNDGV
jgi:hypothetical protein